MLVTVFFKLRWASRKNTFQMLAAFLSPFIIVDASLTVKASAGLPTKSTLSIWLSWFDYPWFVCGQRLAFNHKLTLFCSFSECKISPRGSPVSRCTWSTLQKVREIPRLQKVSPSSTGMLFIIKTEIVSLAPRGVEQHNLPHPQLPQPQHDSCWSSVQRQL